MMNRPNQNSSELMNYEQRCSNSNNYGSFMNSSSPESFPVVMENGIIVHYETLKFSSKIVEEKTVSEEK